MENLKEKASYLLLIDPEKKVSFRIEKLRDTIHSSINMIANPFFNPHITVIDFLHFESYEKKIISCLKETVSYLSPFTLDLSGFGTFNHTFYIQVKPIHEELKKLAAEKASIKNSIKTPVNTQKVYHLTIFKDLSEEENTQIWTEWNDKNFEDSFNVSEFILLRKRHEQRHYQEVARLPLLGAEKKPSYIQGSLFE